jgi:trans-aconitate methyltransferase
MTERMYGDLAPWWPLISPAEEYVAEGAMLAALFAGSGTAVRTVLDLGSGGGHVASHLTGQFDVTMVDLSPAMLAVSEQLNPGCEHIVGDMRTVRLGRRFDGVLVHDALDYMVTEDDVSALAETVAAHLRPGGVALLVPDHVSESFEPSTDWGGSDAPDGRAARYLEWTWDPDPADSWVQTVYSFVLRSADGSVQTASETHRFGLFGRQQWMDLIEGAGLSVTPVLEETLEDRAARTIFVARRAEAT